LILDFVVLTIRVLAGAVGGMWAGRSDLDQKQITAGYAICGAVGGLLGGQALDTMLALSPAFGVIPIGRLIVEVAGSLLASFALCLTIIKVSNKLRR
jgi:hypothetical protein